MNAEEKREQAIQNIVGLLRDNDFAVEFAIVDEPKGIRVVCEVTQEQMDIVINMAKKRGTEN